MSNLTLKDWHNLLYHCISYKNSQQSSTQNRFLLVPSMPPPQSLPQPLSIVLHICGIFSPIKILCELPPAGSQRFGTNSLKYKGNLLRNSLSDEIKTVKCLVIVKQKVNSWNEIEEKEVLKCCQIRTFRDIFVIEFYDNAAVFIHINIFFHVRHNTFHSSFDLSLHFPLKLMSNYD